MSVLVDPQSRYGIEAWKWENPRSRSNPHDSSVKGMSADGYEAYPTMLYKATQKNPWKFEQHVAHSEVEQRNMESRGFVAGGKQAAADAFDKERQEDAVMAAVRNAEDKNMSPKAKAESDAVEQASSRHLRGIPEKKDRP